MELATVLQNAQVLVNRLQNEIEGGEKDLKAAEEEILELCNRLGGLMIEEVFHGVKEPYQENVIFVKEGRAVFKGMQGLRLKTRFGNSIERRRRRYHIERYGGYYPLDQRLGVWRCVGFTPLMTYLLALYGGSEPYQSGARRLSSTIGFSVSGTAVQRNTEILGSRLAKNPVEVIAAEAQNEACERMIVQIDGTTSPQIREIDGVQGRELLKQPTEYKECNLIVIEKYNNEKMIDRWTGGCYGPRAEFEDYARQAGMKMGFMKAREVVFIADGAKHNWEIQNTYFPDSHAVLDFFHVLEHLAEFCALFRDESFGKRQYGKWRAMLWDGDVLQVIREMNDGLVNVRDRSEAVKHINYFTVNKNRMDYDTYRVKGWPCGSGLVEGSCKFVVGKRFKGNGMRWRKKDNEAVLNVRLYAINDQLDEVFSHGCQVG
jgi:hypothetical protein